METFPRDVVEARIVLLLKERCAPQVSVIRFLDWENYGSSAGDEGFATKVEVASKNRRGVVDVTVQVTDNKRSRITFNDLIIDTVYGPPDSWGCLPDNWFNVRLPDPTAKVTGLTSEV